MYRRIVILLSPLVLATLGLSMFVAPQSLAAPSQVPAIVGSVQPPQQGTYAQGFRDGYRQGHDDGEVDGKLDCQRRHQRQSFGAVQNPYERGYADGYPKGYQSGYDRFCHGR